MARHVLTLRGKCYLLLASFEWFAEKAPRIYGDVLPHSTPGLLSVGSVVSSRRQSPQSSDKHRSGCSCRSINSWNLPAGMITRKLGPVLSAAAEAPWTAREGLRGYKGLYMRSILQAERGADFDFLTATGPQQ
ncbi:hypothetical protein BO71DRAFT_470344 [Aspergillus ellipticus CBS 707.79]|uniref:Uncharacterized protein n=1 Tax=Aspergillus ellipticus CBS 707.79 TaxID=1448320 RepID=A0A319DHD8_9EURO|nr:hypothetical protein BO71DRAFT_470344 [Aspergillus ellipticus CBS 707.79]